MGHEIDEIPRQRGVTRREFTPSSSPISSRIPRLGDESSGRRTRSTARLKLPTEIDPREDREEIQKMEMIYHVDNLED